jgi:hypothetical protein
MTVSRRPSERPDADLATFVLAALDQQLAALTELRKTLTAGRPSHPGANLYAAAASVVAARRYAEHVTAALRSVGEVQPVEPAPHSKRAAAGPVSRWNIGTVAPIAMASEAVSPPPRNHQ